MLKFAFFRSHLNDIRADNDNFSGARISSILATFNYLKFMESVKGYFPWMLIFKEEYVT